MHLLKHQILFLSNCLTGLTILIPDHKVNSLLSCTEALQTYHTLHYSNKTGFHIHKTINIEFT